MAETGTVGHPPRVHKPWAGCFFRPLLSHLLPDTFFQSSCYRFEDVTDPASIKADPKADRDVTLYGYVRGTNWRAGSRVHLAGVGDYQASHEKGRGGKWQGCVPSLA